MILTEHDKHRSNDLAIMREAIARPIASLQGRGFVLRREVIVPNRPKSFLDMYHTRIQIVVLLVAGALGLVKFL